MCYKLYYSIFFTFSPILRPTYYFTLKIIKFLYFFLYLYTYPRDLHSFPTRRSSDLDRRHGRGAHLGGVRCVLRTASARLADRRLGLPAVPAHRLPGGAGDAIRRGGRTLRRDRCAAPAVLGRDPRGARADRVLAGAREPTARSAGLE